MNLRDRRDLIDKGQHDLDWAVLWQRLGDEHRIRADGFIVLINKLEVRAEGYIIRRQAIHDEMDRLIELAKRHQTISRRAFDRAKLARQRAQSIIDVINCKRESVKH